MKISARERAGLRVMVEFARRYGQGPTSLGEVARAQELSLAYLERIMPDLRDAGLLASVRGAHGGYALARPPAEITVSEVFQAMEGPLVPLDCLRADGARCDREAICATRNVWELVAKRLEEALDTTSLADVLAQL